MPESKSRTMVERISTGIPGLDKLVQGGVPKNSVFAVTGATGCGKTILACQYVWQGIKNGERTKYISLEQRPEEIISDAKLFGWDFSKAEKQGKLKVLYIPPFGERNFIDRVMNQLLEEKVERLVIDPVSTLLEHYEDDHYNMRNFYYQLVNKIKELKTTALFTTEIPESKSKNSLSRFDIEEFVVDGVVILYYTGLESGAFRSLEVRKMRQTNHTPGSFPFKIVGNKGITVLDQKF